MARCWLTPFLVACACAAPPPAPVVSASHREAPAAPIETVTVPGGDEWPAAGSLPRPKPLWRKTGLGGRLTLIRDRKGAIWIARMNAPTAGEIDVKTGDLTGVIRAVKDIVTDDPAEGREYIEGERDVVSRDRRSGRPLTRWVLPAFWAGAAGVQLAVGEERAVLFTRYRWRVMITWSDRESPVLLERPLDDVTHAAVVGNTLVLLNASEGVLASYDLEQHEPPLATLDEGSAVAAVHRNSEGDVCDLLEDLPNVQEYWLRVAARPEHEDWECALYVLARRSPQTVAPTLRGLLVNEHDEQRVAAILSALAADDSVETSKALAPFAAEPSVVDLGREQARRRAWQEIVEHFWRLGRASQFGLCPKRESQRHVRALESGPADGSVGTADPLLVHGIARDGRWCLLCQARRDTNGDGRTEVDIYPRHGNLSGDELKPYVVVGSGDGWESDEFLAADPTSRYLAMREGACMSLVDTQSATAITLPDADLRDEPYLELRRPAAFAPDGRHFAYLRGGEHEMLVVREIASGREITIDPGPELIYKLRFSPDGEHVELLQVLRGGLERYSTTGDVRRCGGHTRAPNWDAPLGAFGTVTRLIRIDDQSSVAGSDVLASFGRDVLVRADDGALQVRNENGESETLVPAQCQGRLQHADPGRHSVVVGCAADEHSKRWLMLCARDGCTRLAKAEPFWGDSWFTPPARFVEIREFTVDMDERRVVSRRPLAAGEVRERAYWEQRDAYAERWDGAKLVGPTKTEWRLRRGPLRWIPP